MGMEQILKQWLQSFEQLSGIKRAPFWESMILADLSIKLGYGTEEQLDQDNLRTILTDEYSIPTQYLWSMIYGFNALDVPEEDVFFVGDTFPEPGQQLNLLVRMRTFDHDTSACLAFFVKTHEGTWKELQYIGYGYDGEEGPDARDPQADKARFRTLQDNYRGKFKPVDKCIEAIILAAWYSEDTARVAEQSHSPTQDA
jgi:hypothetical protein